MNVTQTKRYRRALWAGLTVSAVAHVAALIVVTVPGAGPGDSDAPRAERPAENYDAVEVITIAEQTPPMTPTLSPRPTASTQGAASEEPSPASSSTASLDVLLAGIAPARAAIDLPVQGRPVVTFSDLDLISDDAQLMTALYGDLLAQEEDEDGAGGGLGGLLSSIGSALSGGGHCPTPVTGSGPLILR